MEKAQPISISETHLEKPVFEPVLASTPSTFPGHAGAPSPLVQQPGAEDHAAQVSKMGNTGHRSGHAE